MLKRLPFIYSIRYFLLISFFAFGAWLPSSTLYAQEVDSTQALPDSTTQTPVITPASPNLKITPSQKLVREGNPVTFLVSQVGGEQEEEISILANGNIMPIQLSGGEGEIVLEAEAVKDTNSFVIPNQEIVQIPLIRVKFPLWMRF